MIIEDENGFPTRVTTNKASPPDNTPKATVGSPGGVVNAPVNWGQFIYGTISDYLNPGVLLPAAACFLNWLQGSEPLTSRGLVTAAVLAFIAAEQAVIKMTGNDGLSQRLRSTGQLNGGR